MWIFARIWSLFASHYRWSERTNDWPKQCSWNSSWTRMNDQKWKGMMSVDDLIYLAESSSSKVWKDWFVCFIRISFFILSWSAKCVDLWEGEADRAIKKTAVCGQPMLLFSWPNGEVRYFFTWWRWGGSNPCPETVPHTDVYSLSHVWIIQQFAHELTAAECVSEFSCREAKRIPCLEFHWILLTATAQNTLLTGGCEPIVGYYAAKATARFPPNTLASLVFAFNLSWLLRNHSAAVRIRHIPVETRTPPVFDRHIQFITSLAFRQ